LLEVCGGVNADYVTFLQVFILLLYLRFIVNIGQLPDSALQKIEQLPDSPPPPTNNERDNCQAQTPQKGMYNI